MITPEEIISRLGLEPHPGEGGYYVETYRADERLAAAALDPRYGGARAVGTAIYFLLTGETSSAMHRLQSDEIFHFYLGDPVEMLHLYPDGHGEVVLLGPGISAGIRPQVAVPRGVWQGARLVSGGRLALLGTTVAPGFDFADFTLGARDRLQADYPEHAAMIADLTR